MPKVLHLGAGRVWGGIEALLATLATESKRNPTPEHLFAFSFDTVVSERMRSLGERPFILGAMGVRRPWEILRARRKLRRILQTTRPNCVLSHGTWIHGLLGSEVRRAQIPLGLWLHGPVSLGSWPDLLARAVRPNFVIANSHHTNERTRWLFPSVRREVLYCAVPPPVAIPGDEAVEDLRTELGASKGSVVILQASRLDPWKGHRLLIDSLARLPADGAWVAWMAGGPQSAEQEAYFDELAESIRARDLQHRVKLLGQRSDVRGLMAAADIYCQPNTGAEPFGIASVEALYAGLPIVATDLGGAQEVVTRSTGLLTAPKPDSLAGALRRLIEDPSLREQLGRAGPERARELCDPAAHLASLSRLVQDVAPASATRTPT